MTAEEFEQARPQFGVTRLRHCDGPEGIYVGHRVGHPECLIIDDGTFQPRMWHLDDCEVA